jgi:hypothetical protein
MIGKSAPADADTEGAFDGVIAIALPGTANSENVNLQNRQFAEFLWRAEEAYRNGGLLIL